MQPNCLPAIMEADGRNPKIREAPSTCVAREDPCDVRWCQLSQFHAINYETTLCAARFSWLRSKSGSISKTPVGKSACVCSFFVCEPFWVKGVPTANQLSIEASPTNIGLYRNSKQPSMPRTQHDKQKQTTRASAMLVAALGNLLLGFFLGIPRAQFPQSSRATGGSPAILP